jgi:transposase
VADRFHLLRNLRDAMERFFLQHGPLLKQAAHAVTEQLQQEAVGRAAPPNPGTARTQESEALSHQHHAAAIERYHRIHALRTKDVDVANIARHVGVSRETVYRYLRMSEPPPRKQARNRRAKRVDPYLPYILQRWNDGCRSARQIYRELLAQGYQSGESSVQRYVHQLRLETGIPYKFRQAHPAPVYNVMAERQQPLSARQVAHVCLARVEQRQARHELYLRHLCTMDASIAQTYEHVQAFASMVRERRGEHLDGWLNEVLEAGVPQLRAFARGIYKDYAAVKAGLTLVYSNGQTEAQVQRLKLLKRGMYGQAGFDLLRKRVLHRELKIPGMRRSKTTAHLLAA